MGEDAITSIEIALVFSVIVLGARTVALFHAAFHVPYVHGRLTSALDNQEPEIGRLVRNLGFQSPYAEIAGGLIRSARAASDSELPKVLRSGAIRARALSRRRFSRGQALDLVALALAIGIAAFARDGLPTETLFWALGGALVTVLVLTLLARNRLQAAVSRSLEQLVENLAKRPSTHLGPSSGPEPPDDSTSASPAGRPALCPTCGRELP